jgi:hypothetical protein
MALAELLTAQTSLLDRYEQWLFTLYPQMWKEVQKMTQRNALPAVDYSAVAEYIDVKAVADAIGVDRLVQLIGAERVVQELGAERVAQILHQLIGAERVAQELGAERVIAALGPEKALEVVLRQMTPEQQRQLRQRLPSE